MERRSLLLRLHSRSPRVKRYRDAVENSLRSGISDGRSARASERSADWHVTFRHSGSIEHFYHFLLGVFVPLIYTLSNTWSKEQFTSILIRSCGPLDELIREIGDNRIKIIDKHEHERLRIAKEVGVSRGDVSPVAQHSPVRFSSIQGYDDPIFFDCFKFRESQRILLNFDKIKYERTWLLQRWSAGGGRILLIQRGPSHPFYHSERSENKGSGQERRSIANHDELYRSLRRRHVGSLNVMTEGLTLARQIALFSLADIIIAQHGAALANTVWAKPTATVIEILPVNCHSHYDFFFNLARCLGLRYHRVWQKDDHGDVDVAAISRIVEGFITHPTNLRTAKLRSALFRGSRRTFRGRRWLRSFASRACAKAARIARKAVKGVTSAYRQHGA